MLNRPMPGELYRHFKGNLYRIVTLAKHSETGEDLVVYQALYGEYQVYARPLAMFMEPVDREKYPNAGQNCRFEKVPELIQTPVMAPTTDTGVRSVQGQEKCQISNTFSEDVTEVSCESEIRNDVLLTEKVDKIRTNEAGAFETKTTETSTTKAETTNSETSESSILEEAPEEELNIDPLVLEFFDAGSYGERLNILAALHHRITDEMITTMALSVDLEVGEGDTEDRYEELKNCLLTFEKYEGNRLR